MSSDIEIAFGKKPLGLEGFLVRQGYVLDESDDEEVQLYCHGVTDWPNVYYTPDFKRAGRDISSLLDINFPNDDSDARDEATRLSKEIVKIFGRDFRAYLYDENLDEYFEVDDL